jgi:hypothetical protein
MVTIPRTFFEIMANRIINFCIWLIRGLEAVLNREKRAKFGGGTLGRNSFFSGLIVSKRAFVGLLQAMRAV